MGVKRANCTTVLDNWRQLYLPGCNYYQGQPNYFSTIQNWDIAKGRPQFEITFFSGDWRCLIWQLSNQSICMSVFLKNWDLTVVRFKTVRSYSCPPWNCKILQLSQCQESTHSFHWQLGHWQLSPLTVVSTDSCPHWQLSPLTVVRTDSCPIWQLSDLTVVWSDS